MVADLDYTLAQGFGITSHSPTPGLLKVVVYGTMPVTGDGVFANLHFTAIVKAGAEKPISIRPPAELGHDPGRSRERFEHFWYCRRQIRGATDYIKSRGCQVSPGPPHGRRSNRNRTDRKRGLLT